ncbi:MAG TPA: hypothetical protein DEQ87_13085 [Algoriphagus sp.]|jgi:hypothetical protein|nr:hypothetical protein [Algoriphagus sp.]MAN86840.1 hypothetical protein [Algoriphagus sp.]HAD50806.1 hypothetical protein [Algoriphagus sp.]HAH35516.1 hypothetical protein [Algoriphagus sp.]HAS59454.1 hypothetical protein [Algoriphagus sp.]|tara:strand:+ start:2479 stop:2733 length:255 start_codon:yes stop_codon:yes gene_type:complete
MIMDIAKKKLELIHWLSKLENESVLEKIDQIRLDSLTEKQKEFFRPIEEDELIQSLQEAESDYKRGKIISQEELVKRIKKGKIL